MHVILMSIYFFFIFLMSTRCITLLSLINFATKIMWPIYYFPVPTRGTLSVSKKFENLLLHFTWSWWSKWWPVATPSLVRWVAVRCHRLQEQNPPSKKSPVTNPMWSLPTLSVTVMWQQYTASHIGWALKTLWRSYSGFSQWWLASHAPPLSSHRPSKAG